MTNQTLFCNEVEPSICKMAAVSGNKITKIHKRNGFYFCHFNGSLIKTSEARKRLLDNYNFVDSNNKPVS